MKKKTLVLGMGVTGLSLARHLARRGADIHAVDTRRRPPCGAEFKRDFPGAPLLCDDAAKWPRARFDDYEAVAASPGLCARALRIPPQKRVCELELLAVAWNELPAPPRLFTLTGSNGKSTVCALAASIARRAGFRAEAVGNIGRPMLDSFHAWRQHPEKAPQAVVMELSSFQLEFARQLPPAEAAAFLNFSPDHLDRHRTAARYAAAKMRIFKNAQAFVFCGDDAGAAAVIPRRAARRSAAVLSFGLAAGGDARFARGALWFNNKKLCAAGEMSAALAAMPQNAAAAAALLAPLQISPAAMRRAMAAFAPAPHRMQPVAEVGGALFINDSKATNVGAMLFALRQMAAAKKKVVLLAGGDGKGQSFSPLAAPRALFESLRVAFVFGRDGKTLGAAMAAAGARVMPAADLPAAVAAAARLARAGDAVLLSPACASFDMFRDYAHRGRVFADAARALDGAVTLSAGDGEGGGDSAAINNNHDSRKTSPRRRAASRCRAAMRRNAPPNSGGKFYHLFFFQQRGTRRKEHTMNNHHFHSRAAGRPAGVMHRLRTLWPRFLMLFGVRRRETPAGFSGK